MRKALYLVTRDNYLIYGLKQTLSQMQVEPIPLELLAPKDCQKIASAHSKYDLIYLMGDADILRFIHFHYSALNIVQIPPHCRPTELSDFLQQSARKNAREREFYIDNGMSLFTRREEEILRCLQKGMAPCDIARKIQRSEKTVSHYKRLIMEKTGCKSHIQLIELLHSSPVA